MPNLLPRLLGRYAVFLERFRGRYDLAERFYRRALALDPDMAKIRGQYAVFLETVRKRYDDAEAEYRRALAATPGDPALLGDYADFLENVRRDYDRAEEYYRRALAAAPDHPNNLTNYATFLTEVRGDHDGAEALYRRALRAAPNHRNALFKYAIFLTDVRQDYPLAEALYRRGIEVAPGNLAMRANFAGLLLMQGRREEGLAALAEAMSLPGFDSPSADAAECRFYAIVHGDPDGWLPALRALRRLLDAGVRSPGFRLDPHVAIASERGHPWAGWIAALAQVLVDEAAPEILEAWPEWRGALPGDVH